MFSRFRSVPWGWRWERKDSNVRMGENRVIHTCVKSSYCVTVTIKITQTGHCTAAAGANM